MKVRASARQWQRQRPREVLCHGCLALACAAGVLAGCVAGTSDLLDGVRAVSTGVFCGLVARWMVFPVIRHKSGKAVADNDEW